MFINKYKRIFLSYKKRSIIDLNIISPSLELFINSIYLKLYNNNTKTLTIPSLKLGNINNDEIIISENILNIAGNQKLFKKSR